MIVESAVAVEYSSRIIQSLKLTERSLVVEVGSGRDGLLDHIAAHGPRVLQVEVDVASGRDRALHLRKEHGRADLVLIGNDPPADAQVVDDLASGLPLFLAWNGTFALEVPYESGLSLRTIEWLLESHVLRLYDVELPIAEDGRVRLWGCHSADVRRTTPRLRQLLADED